jgi:hypothetical protein
VLQYILETAERGTQRIYHTRLTIFQRLSNDEYLGKIFIILFYIVVLHYNLLNQYFLAYELFVICDLTHIFRRIICGARLSRK